MDGGPPAIPVFFHTLEELHVRNDSGISAVDAAGLRAVLIAMLAAITGCDKKVAWRGVSTDGKAAGRAANPDATTRGPADGKPG